MEQLPKIIDTKQAPVNIEIHSYMRDHQFSGRVVLPAVESCQLLASNIQEHIPRVNARDLYDASFDKFIDIQPDQTEIHALNEIEVFENGNIVSRLITKTKSKKAGITRTKEHVTLTFRKEEQKFHELPFDLASALDGICFQIPSRKIYNDLVLFGPAYHNIKDILYLTRNGSTANIYAASHNALIEPLGSPFPFDAALHAACIWGQRFCGIVAFPVGFDRRSIIMPTVPGETYFSKIIPVEINSDLLIFDIWIYDHDGNLHEAAFGVKIKDVNAGRIQPPEWIKENNNSLKNISSQCEAISVVEKNTVADFSVKALSNDELDRQKSMMERRGKSFVSARLACKYLSRKLANNDRISPANEIITISDKIYPACPLPNGSAPFRCSVSHDNRFAVAVASCNRVGIDVEEMSEKVLKSLRFYMSDDEKNLVHSSQLGGIEASLRIWSIKESVTKALDIKLAESWRIVQVNNIGQDISTLLINKKQINAYHDIVDNHLFTYLEIEDEVNP